MEIPGIQLVDVRSEKEFRSGHIKNAFLINWNDADQFEERMQYIDKNKPVYVYCLAGSRSTAAANWMKENGYKNVIELEGGINNWKKAQLPLEGVQEEKQISYKEYAASLPVDQTTLVNIGSPGCPPCKKMEPILTEIQTDPSLHFKMITIDAAIHTDIVKALRIEPIPVFIVYKKGKEVWRKEGIITKQELENQLK